MQVGAMKEARVLAPADFSVGMKAEFDREITPEDVRIFSDLSGDHNPLHNDEAYAAGTNYGARIVHGAFQVGLASTMAGMYVPGRSAVVGSFQCRFPAPLIYPCRVRVHGEVTNWNPGTLTGTLRVRVVELSRSVLTAEIHVGFGLHEERTAADAGAQEQVVRDSGKPVVVVTGAAGGLGQHLTSALANQYHVVGVARSIPTIQAGIGDAGGPEWVRADLVESDWEAVLDRQLAGRPVYGFVHAAWPGIAQGGLLDSELDSVAKQVDFGSQVTIRVARFLRSHSGESARLVILGTTAATLSPVLNMAPYSLGKAVLEHAVRLLAPELARRNITVNLVAPSFIPVGMNASKTSRIVLSAAAKVPMGRLGSPDDVAAAVEFLLSPGAGFISGQCLPLTGGEL